MKNILILILLSVLFVSCEETIQLDLTQSPSKIVIEGLVTNKTNYNAVKVTRTGDFYATGETPRVTNALVTVSDGEGNTFNFVHNPNNHADSAGIYIPQTPFQGIVGRTYTLRVDVDGSVFEGQDQLFAVTKMDSLTYRIDEKEAEDPELEGRIYNVLMFTKEPRNEVNYYYFEFFRNDSLKFDSDTDIYYSDDEFLAEKIDGIESPLLYSLNDKARVVMYSISRNGFVYFNDLSSLLNNDAGGMFGPIPASPRSNLTNGALGFFQVSAIDELDIKIE